MSPILRRYTDALSLLDIMRHNRITLLLPDRWFDRTDASGLEKWATLKAGADPKGQVYAICLAEGTEQAHHWQLFAGNPYGVCIQFDREDFTKHIDGIGGHLLHGPVLYRGLRQLQNIDITLDMLPFLKRDSFQAEKEYRVVAWKHYLLADETFKIPFPAKLIKHVVLGPGIPQQLAQTLKAVACEQAGCDQITFAHSRINNSNSWNKALEAAAFKISTT